MTSAGPALTKRETGCPRPSPLASPSARRVGTTLVEPGVRYVPFCARRTKASTTSGTTSGSSVMVPQSVSMKARVGVLFSISPHQRLIVGQWPRLRRRGTCICTAGGIRRTSGRGVTPAQTHARRALYPRIAIGEQTDRHGRVPARGGRFAIDGGDRGHAILPVGIATPLGFDLRRQIHVETPGLSEQETRTASTIIAFHAVAIWRDPTQRFSATSSNGGAHIGRRVAEQRVDLIGHRRSNVPDCVRRSPHTFTAVPPRYA